MHRYSTHFRPWLSAPLAVLALAAWLALAHVPVSGADPAPPGGAAVLLDPTPTPTPLPGPLPRQPGLGRQAPPSRCRLEETPSVSPDTDESSLDDVVIVSANDAWAVGSAGDHAGTAYRPLVLHWDGQDWREAPLPALDEPLAFLHSVAAAGPDDVWAVGRAGPGTSRDYRTLILHWDGVQWRRAPSPNIGTQGSSLLGVTAISRTDAWAVGFAGPYLNRTDQALTLHWDGQQWMVVPTPAVGVGASLEAVASAPGGQGVWAVGQSYTEMGIAKSLVLQWDGTQWRHIPSPTPGSGVAYLRGVVALSNSDAWAVGDYTLGMRAQTLVLHWDGAAWTPTASPNPGTEGAFLNAVAAVSPTDIWAVGQYTLNTFVSETLALHWNGATWTALPRTNLGPLYGVGAAPAGVWAVGERWTRAYPPGSAGTLIERAVGICP